MSTFDSIDFFTDPSLVPDPHPYFDYLRSQEPGAAAAAPRGRGRHRLGRSHRGLQGPRHLLEHRRARRAVSPDAVPARGRRHQPADRPAPQLLPDVRAHGHHGSAEPHPRPVGAEQAADPEPAEAERGVHVAARRPPARRVPHRRRVRVHRRILQAVRHLVDRRPARRSRGGPQGVPRGLGRRRPGRGWGHWTTSRSAPTHWSGSTRSSATTSRTGAANRATTC